MEADLHDPTPGSGSADTGFQPQRITGSLDRNVKITTILQIDCQPRFICLVTPWSKVRCLCRPAGIFLQRFGTMDEIELSGRGRQWKWMGIVVAIAGLGLAGFPPFGTYLGKSLMDESARSFGQGWVIWVFSAASALTGAAVLRGAARVFLCWGACSRR